MIYFDHNATSPLLPQARAAWLEAEDRFPGNPSSPHRLGARAENALDDARQRLAAILGCDAADIVWTSGATEACNTALLQAASPSDSTTPVWVSAIEHPAVLETALRRFGPRLNTIPVDANGVVQLDGLKTQLVRARPAMVAVMAANNETGVLQPWREARELCARHGVPFFCDATQWCGRIRAQGLGACDFVAGSAHKFGGPRGVGFLKTSNRARFNPLLRGGKQQDARRAGTENVPGILAMVAALEWCEAQLAHGADAARRIWRDRFTDELCASMSGVRVNGANADRLWNTLSVIMPAADCRQRWVVKLDKAGFAVSTGSACASGSEQPSHVLTAMGLRTGEAGRALRFSAGWTTTENDWSELLRALRHIQPELQRVAR